MQSNEFKINHFTFPKKLYDVLANKTSLNINVFSGRRALKDNVLDMESFDSKFSEITTHGNFINLNGGLLSDQKFNITLKIKRYNNLILNILYIFL